MKRAKKCTLPVSGARGLPGADGRSGEDGDVGFSGRPGRTGRNGEKGFAGAQGDTGLRGRDGAPGDQGPTGLNGKTYSIYICVCVCVCVSMRGRLYVRSCKVKPTIFNVFFNKFQNKMFRMQFVFYYKLFPLVKHFL